MFNTRLTDDKHTIRQVIWYPRYVPPEANQIEIGLEPDEFSKTWFTECCDDVSSYEETIWKAISPLAAVNISA